MNVLLVDHTPVQRRILQQHLSTIGVGEIVQAENAAAAIACISNSPSPFDLIIADLMTAPRDGLALLQALATNAGHQRPPLAVVGCLTKAMQCAMQSLAKALNYPLAGFIGNPLHTGGISHIFENLTCRETRTHASTATGEQPPELEFSLEEINTGLAMEQFAAFFQPVVTARTRRLAGVEVFARWHHPLHGIVQPLAFVPVLERAGLIHLLTERITAQTAMAQAQLRDLGIDITAVINLPLASLQDYDVVHKSCEIVDQYAVPAHSISFQIIEDAGICQRNQTLETLARLRLHGFGLVLDGFGTGQSSLQVLDSLPASTLNIDAAYIGDIHANSMHRQLVKSIVDIGRHINAAVVAKGVESARQCHYLAHIGCNLVQGNHIDSPMPLQLLLERYRSSIEALPHGAFSPGQHLHLVPTQAMP